MALILVRPLSGIGSVWELSPDLFVVIIFGMRSKRKSRNNEAKDNYKRFHIIINSNRCNGPYDNVCGTQYYRQTNTSLHVDKGHKHNNRT